MWKSGRSKGYHVAAPIEVSVHLTTAKAVTYYGLPDLEESDRLVE